MLAVIMIARPGIVLARYLITNQAIAGPFTNLICGRAGRSSRTISPAASPTG
jgi:hypothetical protein